MHERGDNGCVKAEVDDITYVNVHKEGPTVPRNRRGHKMIFANLIDLYEQTEYATNEYDQ